jgi:hypothetical protein
MAATTGQTSWQLRRHDGLFRSDSQADSAGPIPVTRSVTRTTERARSEATPDHDAAARSSGAQGLTIEDTQRGTGCRELR